MKKFFCLLFFAFNVVFSLEQSVAILPSEGVGAVSEDEIEILTDRMRESALKVLPVAQFSLLKQETVYNRLGGMEEYLEECRQSSCIVNLGKKAKVDYVAQCRVRRSGGRLWMTVELYNVSSEKQLGSFTRDAQNFYGLIDLIDKNVPEVFRKIPGVPASAVAPPAPSFAGGIGGVNISGKSMDSYVIRIETEPEGAMLSFNGRPNSTCPRAPCNAMIPRNSEILIIATLEQHLDLDTLVKATRNEQRIKLKLRPDYGILNLKAGAMSNIGNAEGWEASANGKPLYFSQNRLSPGKYSVVLSNKCYENIEFPVGINRESYETFDVSKYLRIKEGILSLKAARGTELVSEDVYVNGEHVGKTPYLGTVPVCSKIHVGNEEVNVVPKHGETVDYTHYLQGSSGIVSISFYRPVVKSVHAYGGKEYLRKGLSAMIGLGIMDLASSSEFGFFIGGGAMGSDIGEFIVGGEYKKTLHISRFIALPLSLGLGGRGQFFNLEDEVIEFLAAKKETTRDSINEWTWSFDIIPAADLEIFFGRSVSLYAGYMYRISFRYKEIPDEYYKAAKARERVFGVPGTLRFGIRFH